MYIFVQLCRQMIPRFPAIDMSRINFIAVENEGIVSIATGHSITNSADIHAPTVTFQVEVVLVLLQLQH